MNIKYKQQFVNLTPHVLNIISKGEILEIPKHKFYLRAEEEVVSHRYVQVDNHLMRVVKKEYTTTFCVFASGKDALRRHYFSTNDLYIVSRLAFNHIPEEFKKLYFFVCPDDLQRDDEGNVIGASGFSE